MCAAKKFEDACENGLGEVLLFKQGKSSLDSVKVEVPAVDAKEIREHLDISQQDFAERFGIPIASLRNWEQGRRSPDQPTSILLYLISKIPDQIEKEIKKIKSQS